jgi:Amt family ammonium transporter
MEERKAPPISNPADAQMDVCGRPDCAKALQHAQNRYRHLYETAAAAVFELDLAGNLVAANPAMVGMLGYDSEDRLIRASAGGALFIDSAEHERWVARLRRDGRTINEEKAMRSRDGRRIVLVGSTHLVHDADANPVGYQGSALDATRVHELSRKLAYEASHDPLTALANRRELEGRIEDLIADSAATHALCYFDLDLFKVVNDTCGHAAGDELLRQLGAYLAAGIDSKHTLARLGGDEFAMLLRDVDIAEAAAAANDLLETIHRFSFRWDERSVDIRASIGVVPIDQSVSLSEVLGAADAACYAAKEKGRNRVHVQEPNDKTVQRRISEMRLVLDTKHALTENRMRLFQQAIVPTAGPGDGLMRFEVLVRMQDWDGEIVSPAVFLPAVERYNLSRDVDRWVVTHFLQWVAQTPGAGERLAHASINLSGNSIGDPKLLHFLCGVLDDQNVPGDRLCFEVTETAAVQNLAAARSFIATLKERGCKFALDDFGSGLSSFGYLKNLPVDFVKIDGMFVRGLRNDRTDRAIVRSINEVAHSMGLETVAEFVEDEATLRIVRELAIDYAQGFAFGRPTPIEDLSPVADCAPALRRELG